LYFSCGNYQVLGQARITKVVGYFTTNPTKFDLHFSDFFYNFLPNLQESGNSLYYFSCTFAAGALETLDPYAYNLAFCGKALRLK
jgi:hypothetical protein